MEYGREHFSISESIEPEMVEPTIEGELLYVRLLHPHLKEVLDKELQRGNLIQSAWRGWPDKDSILVDMKLPLDRNHAVRSDVKFEELNDVQFCKEAYICGNPRHYLRY